jgi:hypothetical protein
LKRAGGKDMSLQEIIKRIDDLNRLHKLNGKEFERLIHEGLSADLPFCVLPNVTLFRPDQFRAEDPDTAGEGRINSRAYEIDNLLHYRRNEVDIILIIEAKLPAIRIEGRKWLYTRIDKNTKREVTKDASEQIKSHALTILRYLRPTGRNVELKVYGLLVTGDPSAPVSDAQTEGSVQTRMCSYRDLPEFINYIRENGSIKGEQAQFLRVAQSEYMSLLRLGIPLNTLGHPELRHAIKYVDRCKRDIDHELYRIFAPKGRRWAINGTAGMGKSVLLAYATAVFACNHKLEERGAFVELTAYQQKSIELGLKDHRQRNIWVFAMKPKQLSVLELLYSNFVRDLSDESSDDLYFIKPRFDVWMDEKGIPKGCNILVIDESHDLSDAGQEMVREWHESSKEHYLLIACDRHQKIRLSDSRATIIKGLSFTGHSKFLRRNYRNPFPVYAAAVGLMFRWFANDGVKVIPKVDQFKDLLGFETSAAILENRVIVSLKDDSHPANLWSHSVSNFRSCAAVYSHLIQQNLASSEVLWVRFSKEDPDFNYEQLHCFTYHNFCSSESAALVDKYVKGQEFPIVVVEGFPNHMDEGALPVSESDPITNEEKKMWSFRRQVYICASRATAFLYFVCDVPETDNIKRIKGELDNLINALSLCSAPHETGSKEWRFTIAKTQHLRKIEVFDHLQEEAENITSNQKTSTPSNEYVPSDHLPPSVAVSIQSTDQEPTKPTTKEIFELIEDKAGRKGAFPTIPAISAPELTPFPVQKLPHIETHVKHHQAHAVLPPPSQKVPPQKIQPATRVRVTVKQPVVMSELAAALGRTVQNTISNFNSIGGSANAKTILSDNDALQLAELFNVDLVIVKSS